MKQVFYLLLLSLMSFATVKLKAQTALQVQVHEVDGARTTTTKTFSQLSEAYRFLQDWQQQSLRKGHLAASVDTFYFQDSSWQAYLFLGPQYQWLQLSLDSLPPLLRQQLNLNPREWEGKPINPQRLARLHQRILQHCENNGYPFAQSRLYLVEKQEQSVRAAIIVDRGDLVKIDSIVVTGDVEVANSFLFPYLEIFPGSVYDESKLKQIRKKINELAFISEEKPWEMHFSIGKNTLYLFLKEKKSNQLNALIGLQPNTEATQKFMLTADALLALKNSFGIGESIGLSFQNLQYQSPRLNVEALLPYLAGSRFGADLAFNLFKRDTTFVRVTWGAGIRYQLNAGDYVRLSYQQESNRMISFEQAALIQNKTLPDNIDLRTRSLIMQYRLSHTDYQMNPRKGWEVNLSMAGAFRQIQDNPAISGIADGTGFDYGQLYDSVRQQVAQYRIAAQVAYYLPIARQFTLMIGYDGAYLAGDQLFQNELYQIGGFKRLRGFDEQSIFANQYHIATLELRLLLSENARFFVFADQGFFTTRFANIDTKDYPLGLGLGLHLDTGSGLFTMALGVGKQATSSIQLRQMKIHFGYAAYF